MTRVVVVGHGMVGAPLRRGAAGRGPARRFDVTVARAPRPSSPTTACCSREVVAGRSTVATLTAARAPPDPRRRASGAARAPSPSTARRPGRRRRRTATRHRYDARPRHRARAVPPWRARRSGPGAPADGDLPAGVHALRTLDDAREIVAAAVNARRAVVLGGGLLGLEAARGLARRGARRHRASTPRRHLMERQLDATRRAGSSQGAMAQRSA